MEETTPDGNGNPGNGTTESGRNGGGKTRRSTSRGMVRWNALKHGVLSETAVLPTEDKAQFQELLEQLREDRKPEGALEELLVEKIATCFWRLRRVLRYDFGNHQHDPISLTRRRAYEDAKNRVKELMDIKQKLAQDGVTDALKTRLFEMNVTPKPPAVNAGELHTILDQNIAKSKTSTERFKTQAEEWGLSCALPLRMDTLVRYETSIERQLYRAIDQLERLQRQRAGDYVPPPVKVGVSTDV